MIRNRGVIRTIALIVIAILVLSYFGFNLRGFMESPLVQDNLSYVWNGVKMVWNTYLQEPILYLWNTVFLGLLWEAFVGSLENIRDGEPHIFQQLAPQVGTSTAR